MKKILAFLLAALMVMSFAACAQTESNPTETPTETPTTPVTENPADEDITNAANGKEMTSFSIELTRADGTYASLYASSYDGTVTVMMQTDIEKRGELDSSAMAVIADAFEKSGLKELESTPDGIYDGDNASINVAYADETSMYVSLFGELPEAFNTGYAAMVDCFKQVTADIEEYVAKPMVNGEVTQSDEAALNGILENLELEGSADSYSINYMAVDEYFAISMHLSSDEGIASGLQFASAFGSSNPNSLSIVTLKEGVDVNTVAANFENGVSNETFVCAQPESAYIATKDNQVLLVLGAEESYQNTVTAVEAAGWTAYKTLNLM